MTQTFSSLTSFGLFLLTGRLLGPTGLGAVAIGFTAYLIVLGIQRSLVSEPLLIASASVNSAKRAQMTAGGLAAVALLAAAALIIGLITSLVLRGLFSRALLLFLAWIPSALIYDFCRSVLFRDRRGRDAAVTALLWLVVSVAAVPVAIASEHDWVVVACWGIGSVAAAGLGLRQISLTRPIFGGLSEFWLSWSWPLGRFLLGETLIYVAGAQVLVFALGAIVGPQDLGGLSAVQSVFAPMTLLGQAIAAPGLSELARAESRGGGHDRILATRISVVITVLAAFYVISFSLFDDLILHSLFGASFGRYQSLVLPVGIGQIVGAFSSGYYLLLRATRRGQALLATQAITSVARLLPTCWLAVVAGITPAVWGMTIGSSVGAIVIVGVAVRRFSSEGDRSPSLTSSGIDYRS